MTWLLLLSGCALSGDGISALLRANTLVLTGVQSGLEPIESPLESSLAFHAYGDGEYGYEGEISGGALWSSGSVGVRGTALVREDGAWAMFALDLDYRDVAVSGLVLNGETSNGHAVIAENGSLTLSYDVLGTLDVDGDYRGQARLDYTVSTDSASGGRPRYLGTVNGRPVQ